MDTEIYEYRGDDFLPIDIDTLVRRAPDGMLLRPALSSSDSELQSLQGTGTSSQQSLPQNLYGTSSQQTSLSSSSQGVGVSAVFLRLCQSRNIDWVMAQEQWPFHQLEPFRRSVAQHLPAHWGNVSLLRFFLDPLPNVLIELRFFDGLQTALGGKTTGNK